jgi:Protein of unknown function (DUF3106)
MKRVKIICGLALALLMGLVAQPVLAQKPHASAPSHPPGMHAGPRPGAARHPNRNANQAGRPHPGTAHPPSNPNAAHAPQNHPSVNPNNSATNAAGGAGAERDGRALGGLSPGVRQNLREMSPQEQDRFLQNNERFKSLPPQRQAQLRNNLQKWNNLSPTERNAMSDRQRAWERMSPEKRQYVQSTLLPKWQQMSSERKQLVTGRLHTLQGMSPTERQAALDDPQFMRGLNPDEQSVLRGLDSLNAPSHP